MSMELERIQESHKTESGMRYIFAVKGELGGVHFWVEEYTRENGEVRRFGGVESHSKTPFSDSTPGPDNDNCWLIGCPCWHDGSSLMAEETYIPVWQACRSDGDFEPIFRGISRLYGDWLKKETDE